MNINFVGKTFLSKKVFPTPLSKPFIWERGFLFIDGGRIAWNKNIDNLLYLWYYVYMEFVVFFKKL